MKDVQVAIRPSRDRKAYRLRCRFKIEANPSIGRLEIEKVRVAERFVRDMRKQGWENLPGYGFKMKGPFPRVEPVQIRRPRIRTAREMLPEIMLGAQFRDEGQDYAKPVQKLAWSEYWEYEISSVFSREEILIEVPSPHEEIRPL